MNILCVGLTPALQEVRLFASVIPGAVNRALSVTHSAAGKSVNTARVLRTLGGPALATGFIGGDTGNFILRDLDRWGVRHNFVHVPERTRVCVTLLDQATGQTTELVEEARLPRRSAWINFHRSYARLTRRASLVVISGALMPGSSADTYRRFVKLAPGVPVIIDSQKEPLLRVLPLRPFIAKLNVHELENTLGRRFRFDAAILRGARELLTAGAQNVVLTNGAAGAWLITPTGNWHYRPPRIKAVNPIGSGDAVTAGIAFGLWKHRSLVDAVQLGVACGTANALTPIAGDVRLADVRRLLPQVRCRPKT
jgi:tagatose 6-phosphate kinase